jgi:excisionase family DNA binding protein
MSPQSKTVARPPSEDERQLATESSRQLAALIPKNSSSTSINLVRDESGQTIAIPTVALNFLVDILTQMSQGNAVTILPLHAELTTQEAADLLNVSRPFLVKLLESNQLSFRKVGKHRRIYLRDVLAYKENIDRDRHEALNELVAQAQALNMGYE